MSLYIQTIHTRPFIYIVCFTFEYSDALKMEPDTTFITANHRFLLFPLPIVGFLLARTVEFVLQRTLLQCFLSKLFHINLKKKNLFLL